MRRLLAVLALGALTQSALAGWQLDNNASRLSFVTIKAGDVAEVHHFSELSGSVADTGEARVSVALASVDTLIPIRDERMREMLFKTEMFPTAEVSARLDPDWLANLHSGRVDTELMLEMAGKSVPFTTTLFVSRLANGAVQVSTSQPLIANAAVLGLTEGVEQLREVAGLPSISKAVPVSFVLTFQPAE